MSATSCAFLKFEHQYKSEGRYLSKSDTNSDAILSAVEGGDDGVPRELQTNTIGDEDTLDPTGLGNLSDPNPANAPASGTPADDMKAPAIGDTLENLGANGTNSAMDEAVAAAENLMQDVGGAGPAASPTDDAATTEAAATNLIPDIAAEGPVASPTDTPVATLAESAAETLSPQPTPGVPTQYEDELNADQDVPMGGPMGGPTDEEDEMTDNAFSPEYTGDEYDASTSGTTGTTGSSSDEGSPSSASEKTFALNGATQAAATASGDAGLYCDGEQSFSVTNLWGQSVQEMAEEFATMSDQNQSEELARGAAVVACMFGLIVAFVLTLTTLIGWRMCCERWIIGLVALCACVSQGVTFLFFNSKRYCDGDIVHEILNQEPCVFGQGALYSVIALGLYALVMVMACRLPQDDPYGLCCKKRSAARNNQSAGSRSQFGLVGKSAGDVDGPDTADDNTTRSGGERERPGWISEDAREKGENENEII
eukprot:CAMPEP_0172528148 /NCGR_PEP_ID=MMETSP1067-20121228/2627_1 /TAXON_ID=265564 ORGANISM="Thalassiosira punctigera, Strain Tpunct2005C2" /NCGR_SAMPLE_ID=MMETSP1067 /ASSEMBLY_ACC=CAM_ASM_000444 /LENGTH=482 /DNA_ID=CAMNT_0013312015 /DNA_START=270 /DNA_END=1718 /DNA_ORIENTATION=+